MKILYTMLIMTCITTFASETPRKKYTRAELYRIKEILSSNRRMYFYLKHAPTPHNTPKTSPELKSLGNTNVPLLTLGDKK